ncbi:MAG: NAD-specific glutamate dehydrogenase, partial [Pseudomonadota bacterium]
MHTQLDKFFCDSTIFIDKIMAEVTELNNKPGFASFIKQFFTRVLNHNIYGCNYVELHNIAIQTYSFIAKRQKQEIKVRLYNPSLKKDGWVSDYSILEILNQDMPFIIDSINVELQKQGITIHRIIHPILTIKRQKSGELIEVNDFDNNSTSNESIIHYQITKINTKELAKKIEANLLELLTIIRFAVEDWQVMLTRLQNVTANLVEHKTIESEVNHFLSWLSEDNFTFLGYKSFYKELKQPIATVSSEDLGIFKCHDLQLLTALDNEVVYLQKSSPQENFVIGKLNYTSHVHNHTNLDYIYIKTTKDNVTHVHFFIGLFTSILFYQSATLIPIIRQKLKAVITRSGFSPTSYSGKELITIINNIARDELFQISEDELLNVAMEVYSLLTCPKLRLFIRRNNLGNYVSCMIFMPSSAFNADISEKIQTRLEQYLSGQVINNYMQLTSMKLAYIHLIIIPNTSLSPQILDEQTLELELQQLAQQWTEELHINFTNRVDNYNTEYLFSQYKSAFPITYRETFNTSTAIEDILIISNHLPQEKIIFKLNTTDEQSINLKLYSLKDKIPLSNIMPILENMGFKIIDECVFLIKPLNIQDTVWVHNFRLAAFDSETIIRIASLTLNIESSLLQIFSKFVDNDGFNKLVVSAGLLWQQVNLIRAIAKYIKQTEFIYSQPYIEEVLSKNAVIIQLLISLFYQNFDPKRKKSDKAVLDLHKKLDNALRSVTITAEDHIMRRFIGTITAITRTNYFQNDEDGLAKTYISIKFDSTKVPNLPLPLPYAEVFVYSTQFEAIHL